MTIQQDYYNNLVTRASEDPDYRARLRKDPKGTLQRAMEEAAGQPVRLHDNLNVRVYEDSRDVVNIVLPHVDDVASDDIWDTERLAILSSSTTVCGICGTSCSGCGRTCIH